MKCHLNLGHMRMDFQRDNVPLLFSVKQECRTGWHFESLLHFLCQCTDTNLSSRVNTIMKNNGVLNYRDITFSHLNAKLTGYLATICQLLSVEFILVCSNQSNDDTHNPS